MAEHVGRCMVLDNADYFETVSKKCDVSSHMQRQRKTELLDLEAQQRWKADHLKQRMKADADVRKGCYDRIVWVGSSRIRVDVEKGHAFWVAQKKERERKRSCLDHRDNKQTDAAPAHKVAKTCASVLTLEIDKSDDDFFGALLSDSVSNFVCKVQVLPNSRYGDLIHEIRGNINREFSLVLACGVCLDDLRRDYLVKDIPDMVADPTGNDACKGVAEDLPASKQRDMSRKPENDDRTFKKRQNRNANKRATREAAREAVPKFKSIGLHPKSPAVGSTAQWTPRSWIAARPCLPVGRHQATPASKPKLTSHTACRPPPHSQKNGCVRTSSPIGARPMPIGAPPRRW